MRLSTILLPLLPALAIATSIEDESPPSCAIVRGKFRVRDHPTLNLRRRQEPGFLPSSPQSEPRGRGGGPGDGPPVISDPPRSDPTTVAQPPPKNTPPPETQPPAPTPEPQPQPKPQPQPEPTQAEPIAKPDPGRPQAPGPAQPPSLTPEVGHVTRGSDGQVVTVIRSRTSTVLASTPSQNATASPETADSNLSQSGNSSSSGMDKGKIVGIAVGGAVAVILAAIGIFAFRKWSLKPSNKFRDRLIRKDGMRQTPDSLLHENIRVTPSPSPSPHPFDHPEFGMNGLRNPPSTWRMSHQHTPSMTGSMVGPPSMVGAPSMGGPPSTVGSMVGAPSTSGPPSMVGAYNPYHHAYPQG